MKTRMQPIGNAWSKLPRIVRDLSVELGKKMDLVMLGAETELASALSNLLTNAVRYTPDGGTITVRWERDEDGGARYSVQDTGIGIPARHLPRLTERFYRVDRGRSRAVGGTGLGLAITKHIAMRHDADESNTEFAGVCWAPDGRTMFVNLYSPGMTLAVTGPWERFRA